MFTIEHRILKSLQILFFTSICASMVLAPFVASAQIFVPCGTETWPDKTIVKVDGKDVNVGGTVKNPCGLDDLIAGVQIFINGLILLSAPIASVAFMWAGFLYLTSAGNAGQVEHAHDIFKKVAIGFGFVLGAWLIVNTILVGLLSDAKDYSFLKK